MPTETIDLTNQEFVDYKALINASYDSNSANIPVGYIHYDPIIFDLNGDGIKTTSASNGVYFDHNHDGYSELSAWVAPDDGISGSGVIDAGSGNNRIGLKNGYYSYDSEITAGDGDNYMDLYSCFNTIYTGSGNNSI